MTANKMKTHKGTKKRFKLTANGKVKHRPAGTSHRNVRVSAKRKRNLRGCDVMDDNFVAQVKRSLGKYSR